MQCVFNPLIIQQLFTGCSSNNLLSVVGWREHLFNSPFMGRDNVMYFFPVLSHSVPQKLLHEVEAPLISWVRGCSLEQRMAAHNTWEEPGPQTATQVEDQRAECKCEAVSWTALGVDEYSSEGQTERTLCNLTLGDLEWILGCSVPHPYPKHSDPA